MSRYLYQKMFFEAQMMAMMSGISQIHSFIPITILTLTQSDGSPRFVIPLMGRGLNYLIQDLGLPTPPEEW